MSILDIVLGLLLGYGLFKGLKNGIFVEIASIIALIGTCMSFFIDLVPFPFSRRKLKIQIPALQTDVAEECLLISPHLFGAVPL